MRIGSIIMQAKSIVTLQNTVILLAFSVSIVILFLAVRSVPDLPAAWATAVGAVIGGGMLMLNDWLRHRRIGHEILQQTLLPERVEEYKFIKQQLNLVREEVGDVHIQGVEHLRYRKNRRVSPEFLDQASGKIRQDHEGANDWAHRLDSRLQSLPSIMDARLIVCAPDVLESFHEAYAEFMWWRNKITVTVDQDLFMYWPGYLDAVQNALDNLTLGTQRAIAESLGLAGFEVPGEGAIEAARRQGQMNAQKEAARLKAEAADEETNT